MAGIQHVRQPLRANWYTMFSRKSKLPAADKRLLASQPILNAGVFALRGDAPLWDLWQQAVLEAVQALPKGRQYAADQIGLGLAVYRNDIPLALLPETCNWMSVWRFDEAAGLFTETQPPFGAVGIIHLAGVDPAHPFRQVALASGGIMELDLRWSASADLPSRMVVGVGFRSRQPRRSPGSWADVQPVGNWD